MLDSNQPQHYPIPQPATGYGHTTFVSLHIDSNCHLVLRGGHSVVVTIVCF